MSKKQQRENETMFKPVAGMGGLNPNPAVSPKGMLATWKGLSIWERIDFFAAVIASGCAGAIFGYLLR